MFLKTSDDLLALCNGPDIKNNLFRIDQEPWEFGGDVPDEVTVSTTSEYVLVSDDDLMM